MVKNPYFRLGVGLIVAGAALIALNLWLITKVPLWVPSITRRGYAGFAVVGATMIIAGVMVLMGV